MMNQFTGDLVANPSDRRDTRENTHLVGRTKKRDQFRRGGLTFTKKWQAFLLAEITRDKLEQIEREATSGSGEIEAGTCTAAEAARILDSDQPKPPIDPATLAELRQANERLTEENRLLRERIRELETKLLGDKPPKTGAPAPASGPPLVTPDTKAERPAPTIAREEAPASGPNPLPPVERSAKKTDDSKK
jgi:hypothetical protein